MKTLIFTNNFSILFITWRHILLLFHTDYSIIYNICLQFFVVFSETAKIEKHVAENGMSSNNVKRSHL